MPSKFSDMLAAGYSFTDPSVTLGAALEGATIHQEPKIRIPLATMNRHGLIAGATGTGKTKTLQLLTEQLSAQGVSVFVADMKGDLSGLVMPGDTNDRVTSRATDVGWAWKPAGVPVEFVSLTGGPGVQLRATVSSFGPLLLGKVLSLNETQTSVLSMVFKYSDDNHLLLLDLSDLRAVLQYLSSDEGKTQLAQYGGMSSASVGVLLRKMVELESQGADKFFGEPEFDVRDMLHLTSDGRGIVTCLELTDVQDKPMLFSTFMMWMLAELYHNLPEVGDLPKPKLVFFFDEAHLLFDARPRRFSIRSSRWSDSSGRRESASTWSPRRRRTFPPTSSPSSAIASSTRCARTPPMTTPRSKPPFAPSPRPSSTTSRRRSPRSASVRQS